MGVDRSATPFVVGLLLAGAIAAVAVHPLAAAFPAALLLFVLWFFRDPERQPPPDPRAILSPAHGRVVVAGPRTVSIFMNVFDVHVCRAPVAGRVEAVEHTAGRFLAAYRDDAAEHNERTAIDLDAGGERLRFTLVAGLVARRIVCRVRPGERLEAGARVGVIRFGSRVDVELPSGCAVRVRIGERVRAGESVLAIRTP